jgi:hypothetical protein
MAKHNKKRNVGIIYELLLRFISNSLVEGDKKRAQKALTIIEKRFNKNTELYKEFRLFNALAKTTASGSHIAAAILNETKSAIKRTNSKKLKIEKSRLIKDINYILNDSNFYYRKVPDYKTYAIIHNLFEEWKKEDKSNLTDMFHYENVITEWLLSEKRELVKQSNIEADNLIFNIMTKKLNERYSKFNNEQKQILQNYALYNEEENHHKMRNYLVNLKENTVKKISAYESESDNIIVNSKINSVVKNINELNTDIIDDQLITKFLMLSKLKEELRG